MTIHKPIDLPGSALANLRLGRHRTRDAALTFDAATIDSTGSFLIGELERLDQNLHEPLVAYTWSRDIDLREDVSIADEVSSWTNSSFAAPGGVNPKGKNWIGKDATALAGIQVDIGKTAQPLPLWGMELSWSVPELESSIRIGRPVDQQKYTGLQMKHQMDIDEQVYIGDTDLGYKGLFNSALVTPANAINGASASPLWSGKTPDEQLNDVNTLLTNAWTASGFAVCPGELRLPPAQFARIVSTKVSSAGNISVLKFLQENSIALTVNGRPLNIQPVKWLAGLGASATDRMVAYTKDPQRVRFPLVPLQRLPVQFRGIHHVVPYFGRLGVTELVYPETVAYVDGI